MWCFSQVISMAVLRFTKIHIYKATVHSKESHMSKSWKLEIRNCAQVPCCFIDFNTPFNLLLLVGFTASLSKSKEAILIGSLKTGMFLTITLVTTKTEKSFKALRTKFVSSKLGLY